MVGVARLGGALQGFGSRLVLLMQSHTQTNLVLRKPDSLHFFRIFKEQPNNNSWRSVFVEDVWPWVATKFSGGANRDRTGDLLLAKQALSQLSYGPARGVIVVLLIEVSWWVWVDLNHRPHAYQACALTN